MAIKSEEITSVIQKQLEGFESIGRRNQGQLREDSNMERNLRCSGAPKSLAAVRGLEFRRNRERHTGVRPETGN